MIQPATMDAIAPAPGRMAMVGLTIAVLVIAFYWIEHRNTQVSNLEAFTVTGDEMAEKAAEGDVARRLAIPAIGLFGVLLLLRRDGWRLELRSRLGWLLLGYLALCGLSILWSDDPRLTLRHFSVLTFCSVGALGIARQVTLHDLCLIALAVSTIFIVNSVRTEIVLGTFRPFSPEYRFAGALHPNAQAAYCATMALAAGFLAGRAQRGRTLLWLLCAAAVVLLVLTKSRTVCAAFLVGLLPYGWSAISWPNKMLVGAGAISLGCVLALAVSLLGSDFGDRVVGVALIGRQEEADSLSGRFPLWAELTPHVRDCFLLGHGYRTFWSPQRIESFSRSFEWTVPDGHCAYLDAILDLGVIGVAICVAVVLMSIRDVARRRRATCDIGCGFLLTLLVCRSLNGILESGVGVPTSSVPFIMMCGLAHLGFCCEPDHSPPTEKLPGEAGP